MGSTFVVAHGAWTGAWSWTRVADRLLARGHRVYVPTLSGLGERSHLDPKTITLTTHILDVVNEVLWKDLDRVVLIGHSYGGFVASGVAERIQQRIASLVLVDAFIPEDGQSFADMAPGWALEGEVEPAPPSSEGDYLKEEDRRWSDAKATAQPAGTFTEKAHVTGALQRIARKTYISATFDEAAARLRSDESWIVREIKCGHDVPIDKPDELTEMLVEAADR